MGPQGQPGELPDQRRTVPQAWADLQAAWAEAS